MAKRLYLFGQQLHFVQCRFHPTGCFEGTDSNIQSFVVSYNVHTILRVYENVCKQDVHIVQFTAFNRALSPEHVSFSRTNLVFFPRC
jgi:hypothetical protein